MILRRTLGLAVLFSGVLGAQNLIADGGFENGQFTFGCGAQGYVVSTWFQAGTTVPGADTWTTDCVQKPGLSITFYGHFLSVGAAHGGFRFTAGYGGAVESFGTALSSPLVPGALYTLGAYFTKSQTISGAGGYEVWLSPTQSVAGTQVGVIGAGAVAGTWTCSAIQFVAPAQPGQNLVLKPLAGYLGTDDWYLIPGAAPLYQVNQPGLATGSINGVQGTAWCPGLVIASAAGPPVSISFNAASYDVAYGPGLPIPALVPPAISLPDGQIFNLNLSTVSWLCPGGPAPCNAGPITLSLTLSPALAGVIVSGQVVAFGVGPLGVKLSQPFTLKVTP